MDHGYMHHPMTSSVHVYMSIHGSARPPLQPTPFDTASAPPHPVN